MLDQPPQIVCVAQAIYYEARGESDLGKRAVGHVVLNRSRKFKKTPCEILKQPGQFQVALKRRYSDPEWRKAMQTANNLGKDPTGGALYFRSSHGSWSHRLTTTIGRHRFYK